MSVVFGYLVTEIASAASTILAVVSLSLAPIVIFCAAAWFPDLNRLYLYGAVAGVNMPLDKYLDAVAASRDGLPETVLFVSSFFLGMAAVLFVNFMMNHRSTEARKR